jgi:hypothetical protein
MNALPAPVPNQVPGISQTDIDPMESAPFLNDDETENDLPDKLSSTCRSSMAVERTRHVVEQRWRNRRGASDCGHDNSSEEEEEEEEAEDDEDMEGNEGEEDEEDDDDLFAESAVAGISAWDLLGEGFELEAASKGLFLLYESSTSLTTL